MNGKHALRVHSFGSLFQQPVSLVGCRLFIIFISPKTDCTHRQCHPYRIDTKQGFLAASFIRSFTACKLVLKLTFLGFRAFRVGRCLSKSMKIATFSEWSKVSQTEIIQKEREGFLTGN